MTDNDNERDLLIAIGRAVMWIAWQSSTGISWETYQKESKLAKALAMVEHP